MKMGEPLEVPRLNLMLCVLLGTLVRIFGQSPSPDPSTTPGGYVQLDAAMKNMTKYEGETLRIKCEITGFPLPRYAWYKDGVPLDKLSVATNHFSAKITPWGSRLKIEDMTVDDTGVYICEGSNSFGKESTRGGVIVKKGANPNKDWLSDLDDGDDLDMDSDLFGHNQEYGLPDDGNSRKKNPPKSPKRPGSKDVDESGGSDGYCQPYRGAACARFVANRSIYVRTNTELGNMEEALTARLTIIATTKEISQKCAEAAIPVLCHFAFPLCDLSSRRARPRKVCLEDCKSLERALCKSEYNAAARSNSKSDMSVLPDCLVHADNNENCIPIEYASSIDLDLADTKAEEKENSVLHIVIPCLAIPFCIIILVIVMCLYRNCHRNETQNKQNHKGTSDQESMLMKPTIKARDFPISSVRFLQELGEGSFGRVCRGELVQYAENSLVPIIIKTLRPNCTTRQCSSFWTEVERESELKHPNVLPMLGVCSKDQPFCMLYEYFIFGDLHEYLVVHSPNSDISFSDSAGHERVLRDVDMVGISNQIAGGMDYLSSRGIVHGDIAARNMLIGDGGIVKISDLGISRNIYPLDYYALPGMPPVPVRWMPAEAIQYRKFSTKSDVWSFGVTLWEVFSYGLQPYYGHSNQDVMTLIQGHQILPCPKDCPSRMYSLMVECWHQMASHRSGFHDIHQRLCQWHSENNCTGIEISRTNRLAPGFEFKYGQHGQSSQPSSTGNSNNTASTPLGANQAAYTHDIFPRPLMGRPPHLPSGDPASEAQLVMGSNLGPAVDSNVHQGRQPVVLFKKSSSSASSGASQKSASNHSSQSFAHVKNRQTLLQSK